MIGPEGSSWGQFRIGPGGSSWRQFRIGPEGSSWGQFRIGPGGLTWDSLGLVVIGQCRARVINIYVHMFLKVLVFFYVYDLCLNKTIRYSIFLRKCYYRIFPE